MNPFLNHSFRTVTVLIWFLFACFQFKSSDPKIWISTYLTVSVLYSLDWLRPFQDRGRRILTAGLAKAIGAGYFLWGLYIHLDYPEPDIHSEPFRQSVGLGISALWLFLLPFFQRRA